MSSRRVGWQAFLSGSGYADAAVARFRCEPGIEVALWAHGLEQAGEEVEIHPADQAAVLLREAVEWAVDERDLAARDGLGLVAVAGEDIANRFAASRRTLAQPAGGDCFLTNCAPGRVQRLR